MFAALNATERALVVIALRDLAQSSAQRAEFHAETSPRLAQMYRDDAALALSIIQRAKGQS